MIYNLSSRVGQSSPSHSMETRDDEIPVAAVLAARARGVQEAVNHGLSAILSKMIDYRLFCCLTQNREVLSQSELDRINTLIPQLIAQISASIANQIHEIKREGASESLAVDLGLEDLVDEAVRQSATHAEGRDGAQVQMIG